MPVGPGVPHGYPTEDYVGVIHADAECIPPQLLQLLSEAEQEQLRDKVLRPAAQARAARERRALDPQWRIAEATRLLSEAVQLSQERRVLRSTLAPALQALDAIRLVDGAPIRPPQPAPTAADRLAEALAAVKAAAAAVRDGAYGHAPAEGARSTRTYRLWSELTEALDGSRQSLLRALQEKGFVKARKA